MKTTNALIIIVLLFCIAGLNLSAKALSLDEVIQQNPAFHLIDDIYVLINNQYHQLSEWISFEADQLKIKKEINLQGNKITGLAAPTNPGDAVNLATLEDKLSDFSEVSKIFTPLQPGTYYYEGGNPFYCREVRVFKSGISKISNINENLPCNEHHFCVNGICKKNSELFVKSCVGIIKAARISFDDDQIRQSCIEYCDSNSLIYYESKYLQYKLSKYSYPGLRKIVGMSDFENCKWNIKRGGSDPNSKHFVVVVWCVCKAGIDEDKDGYGAEVDCDDSNSSITVATDGTCDGDGDGHIDFTAGGDDCDDEDPSAWRFVNYYCDNDGDQHISKKPSGKICENEIPDGCQLSPGDDCDDSCSSCYPGSTAYTYCPDGKDQDCDGKVDEVIGEVTVGIYTLNVNNWNGKSCSDKCSNLGKCAFCGQDVVNKECDTGKWISNRRYPYATEFVNYQQSPCKYFIKVQRDCVNGGLIKCNTKINECIFPDIRPSEIKCQCKRRKYA